MVFNVRDKINNFLSPFLFYSMLQNSAYDTDICSPEIQFINLSSGQNPTS
jgi:hypothetical protein